MELHKFKMRRSPPREVFKCCICHLNFYIVSSNLLKLIFLRVLNFRPHYSCFSVMSMRKMVKSYKLSTQAKTSWKHFFFVWHVLDSGLEDDKEHNFTTTITHGKWWVVTVHVLITCIMNNVATQEVMRSEGIWISTLLESRCHFGPDASLKGSDEQQNDLFWWSKLPFTCSWDLITGNLELVANCW